VLRRFRPPLPARVILENAKPAALDGAVRGEILASSGPHVLRGDWWKPQPWAVEIWQVELAGGGLYQLTRTAGGWWIDGVLD